MKKIFIIAIFLTLFACKTEEKPEYVIFSGTVVNTDQPIAMVTGNGLDSKMQISETGTFSDTLNIGNNGFYQFFVGRERTSIYLEKGKNLSVTLDAAEFDETLKYSGDLASENNYLAAKLLWNEKNNNMRDVYSSSEVDFASSFDKQYKAYDSLLKASNVNNETFKNLEKKEIAYSKASAYENYQVSYRYFNDSNDFVVSPTFYDAIKDISYSDTTAYRNSSGYREFLSGHFMRLASEEGDMNNSQNNASTYLSKVNSSLPNGYAKDMMMFEYLQYGLRPDENLEDAYTIYKNSSPNPENFKIISTRYNVLKAITKGNPSPTFTFENHKGGTTDLASLQGKLVYIDVWATWCGPCLREIPSLQKVEEDYKNKNVHFVSISIDEKKDYDTWKTMVTEKNLGGIQLMADNNWKSKFAESYGINSIPRFILLDAKGNIVSADAPRPSEPKLRTMLDGLL